MGGAFFDGLRSNLNACKQWDTFRRQIEMNELTCDLPNYFRQTKTFTNGIWYIDDERPFIVAMQCRIMCMLCDLNREIETERERERESETPSYVEKMI